MDTAVDKGIMQRKTNEDTIVALSTPVGEGGIGIVRMSGKDALSIADKIFVSSDKKRPSSFRTHTIHYGLICDAKEKRALRKSKKRDVIDTVLLTVMRAPKTYTREDIVEINCHGGSVILRRVLQAATRYGARLAEPGEFTKRAFLNGRLDLAQAEAVLDVIRAKTEAGLRVSMGQLEGELSGEISRLRSSLIELCADAEAMIDFPQEDIEISEKQRYIRKICAIRRHLERLADTYNHGAILKNGVTAVICGRTNVGKSSLMNLLLKRDRVIVTSVPGTTRDAIEEMININGVPIRLIDTAGIRRRHDIVEKEGIRKSYSYLAAADLILCLLDGSEGLKKDDRELLKQIRHRYAIVVVNKCDRKLLLDIAEIRRIAGDHDIKKVSCLTKTGIEELEQCIFSKIWSDGGISSHQVMLNNIRHKQALDRAVAALGRAERIMKEDSPLEFFSVDMREGIDSLGEIIGATYTDDVLDVIFSKFCIGK